MNIAEIESQLSELVEQPFDADGFALRLLEIYNAPKATLTKLRKGTQNKGEQPTDLLWARKLYFRPAAKGLVAQTLDALTALKATKSQKPRFLFATDGLEVSMLDLKTDETLHCDFAKLNDHFDFFLPLAGIDKYEAVKENPADIKATGRLAKFHDEVVRHNPEWDTDAKRHALNQFMTRILFCMFAEDTGSFPEDLFVKTITEFGGGDGEYPRVAIETMPTFLLPHKGRYELCDYEKMFCPDLKRAQDIFAMRGIDRDNGCLVVVRPDQYVAHVLPLDAYGQLASFFDRFMLQPSDVRE